jgi:hypothetical protein
MRAFTSIFLCCIFLSTSKAQDLDFKLFLKNFNQSRTPLLVNDKQSSAVIFCQEYDTLSQIMKTKPIPENLVAKYICTNGFCNPDGGYFRYDYGVKVDLSSGFISVLVSRLQYEGDSEWNFDLRETLIITYNNKSEILSRQSLTKDNDRWKSSLKITKDGITVRQIKIIEPKVNQYHHDLRCEYWTTQYKVESNGTIQIISSSQITTGIVIWDKDTEEYKLKE